MLKIKFLSVFFFLTSLFMFSQESINEYKYIIVPSQYGFQKAEDSYQLNSLTKFLFNKAGFIAILSTDNFPDDLAKNRCLALTAKLKKNSSMFSTKMNFDLVSCNNTVVFSSKEGTSKEKDYNKAYHQAVRKTFEGIKARNYKYTPKEAVVEVEVIKEILENKIPKDVIIIIAKEENKTVTPTVKETSDVLYAQPVKNGFQLVDSSPKVVYIIQSTGLKDVYFIKNKSGIIFKQNGKWFLEYYFNDDLIRRDLNIKF
ncbi:MAG: hypothetical protein COA67_01980 [Lutibacter sp.]|nr:MAG: hypothetical protein COA67_01980 [Lutibacter sp.]